jgi:hypothetical protein
MPIEDLTDQVHRMLASFHRQRVPAEHLAFQKALTQLNFDYTPQSIVRIDQLLKQMRERLRPVYAQFFGSEANRNFVCLLGFFVGETVARYRGTRCRWLNHDGLLALLAERGAPASYPRTSGTSVGCEIEGEGILLPLAAIEEALFGDAPRSVLAAADHLMRRAVDVPVLASTTDPSTALAASTTDAAFQLGHAIGSAVSWCVEAALQYESPMAPQLLQLHEGGRTLVISMMDLSFDAAIERGRNCLTRPDDGLAAQVLAYDGFVGLPRYRSDALLLEAARYPGAGDALRAVLALPYRPAKPGQRLALHNFRLLEFPGDQASMHRLHVGLFAGMASAKPPGLWGRYFEDEDSTQNLALRQAAQAPLPWTQADSREDEAPQRQAIALDQFDLQSWLRGLPASEQVYLDADPPEWVRGNPIGAAIRDYPRLLRQGHVVWAVFVQANMALFEREEEDRIGEVVYSTDGSALPDLLLPVANALFALRKQLPAHADAPLQKIARYLEAETERAFGWPVPQTLLPAPDLPARLPDNLRISSLWVVRKHLPEGYLASRIVPVLVSDACPGHVMVVPAKAWPPSLLDFWAAEHKARLAARWTAAWTSLASGGTEESEQYFAARRNALQQYAEQGIKDERMRELARLELPPFTPATSPPPMEWEWLVSTELRSYAELVLRQVERERAQGKPLNQTMARQAFAARATSQLVSAHLLMLAAKRQMPKNSIQLWADEMQFVALGMLCGCDALAERLARLLIALWRDPANYFPALRPEVWVVFQLFARHLDLQLEQRKPVAVRPCLDALMENQAWMGETETVRQLMEAACVEHTETAPQGPFRGLPITLALMLRLRVLAGQSDPGFEHELLRVELGSPQPQEGLSDLSSGIDRLADPLARAVRSRMQRMGYDEAAIEAAVHGGYAPEVQMALARPLRRAQVPEAQHSSSAPAPGWSPIKIVPSSPDANSEAPAQIEGDDETLRFPWTGLAAFGAFALLCWGSFQVFVSSHGGELLVWMSFMVALLTGLMCIAYVVWFCQWLLLWLRIRSGTRRRSPRR